METEPKTIEEKIIRATIGAIESYGLAGATNRKIAEMAGVNLAAINYYFRSKDILIERVIDITLKNAFDLGDIPTAPDASVQERCVAVFLHLVEGGFRYPGLTRAHFSEALSEGSSTSPLKEHVNRFIDALALDLQQRGASLPTTELKVALVQIFSSVMLAILAPNLFAGHGVNLKDPSDARAYVTRLVERLLE